MKVKEFRIVLPITLNEYEKGQSYQVMCNHEDKDELSSSYEQVIAHHPFTDTPFLNGEYTEGWYTKKMHYIGSLYPKWFRWAVPSGLTVLQEECWNAFPYSKSVFMTPNSDREICITVDSLYLENRGTTNNALKLTGKILKKRNATDGKYLKNIEFLDVTDDKHIKKSYRQRTDPKLFTSSTGVGPLVKGWANQDGDRFMTAYKVITCYVKYPGLQNRMESSIIKHYRRWFVRFYRELLCSMDQWYNISVENFPIAGDIGDGIDRRSNPENCEKNTKNRGEKIPVNNFSGDDFKKQCAQEQDEDDITEEEAYHDLDFSTSSPNNHSSPFSDKSSLVLDMSCGDGSTSSTKHRFFLHDGSY